jgi:hypothetical protein
VAINKTKTPRKKQGHHITRTPEWVVPLNGWQHKVITIIEHLNATQENYEATLNFSNALHHQLNRLAYQLYEARKGNLNP